MQPESQQQTASVPPPMNGYIPVKALPTSGGSRGHKTYVAMLASDRNLLATLRFFSLSMLEEDPAQRRRLERRSLVGKRISQCERDGFPPPPSLLRPLDSFLTPSDFCTVEAFLIGGSLLEALLQQQPNASSPARSSSATSTGTTTATLISPTRIRRWLVQITDALTYLHRTVGVAHRSLCLEHLYVREGGDMVVVGGLEECGATKEVAQLPEDGSSRRRHSSASHATATTHRHAKPTATGGCGLYRRTGSRALYTAPELREVPPPSVVLSSSTSVKRSGSNTPRRGAEQRSPSTDSRVTGVRGGSVGSTAPAQPPFTSYDGEAVDVWALGVIFFALLYRRFPFTGEEDISGGSVGVHIQPEEEANTDPLANDLVRGMLQSDPLVRLSLDEVAAHPFLAPSESLVMNVKQAREVATSSIVR